MIKNTGDYTQIATSTNTYVQTYMYKHVYVQTCMVVCNGNGCA